MIRTDSELVTMCLNGDHEAFSELVARYKRLIYSVACKFSRTAKKSMIWHRKHL